MLCIHLQILNQFIVPFVRFKLNYYGNNNNLYDIIYESIKWCVHGHELADILSLILLFT